MSKQIYFVDANIIMYAVGAPHAFKQPTLDILTDISTQRIMAVTSAEVLQEILHRYTSLKRRNDATQVTNHLITLVAEVYPITLTEIQRALQLHLQYPTLTARDSVHVATMLNHNIVMILSADAHFDGLPGITRIDPLDWQHHRP